MDPRKDHVARCALESLGANSTSSGTRPWARPASEMTTSLHGSKQLQEFVESPSSALLQVSVVPNAKGQLDLVFANTVGVASDCAGARCIAMG